MSESGGTSSSRNKMKGTQEMDSEEELWDSEEDDETIARIQRAHFAQAAAMNPRKRIAPKPRRMSQKRKLEAVKNFHDFTKKLKKDTGIRIRGLVGNDLLELSDFSSEDSKSDSDGLSEEEFNVDPSAVKELNEENESYIDPETGDFVEAKKNIIESQKCIRSSPKSMPVDEEPKTLSISDIINEGDLDLTKNVEIAEVEGSELCPDRTTEELLSMKQEENSQDFDITEKLKEMGEISVKPIKKETEGNNTVNEDGNKPETDEEKKPLNPNALNVRRNIRDVMDEKNLDASTLAAQRQESERLARVQEQQKIIREVQRQITLNRQNKTHQKTLSLLQGGSSILKRTVPGQKFNLSNTVLMKLPSGEVKKTIVKPGQVDVVKVSKPTTSGAQKIGRPENKVVEIVDSSSGEETTSSSSDSDDCIMLSDSEVAASPEPQEEDPANSGLHVNDAYNIPDEQGRVLINIGHPENEEDIFVAPQIARIIKPHQIGGVRFLFDNIIESVERFSTSTGFGCILAHSMGLGKTLQIVCFCDIFLRHTSSKTVLCIMPINTLQNWVAEFNMWLPLDASNSPLAAHGEVRPRNFPIYVLNDSHKTLQMRAKVVKDWTTTGGVLMIGYELYRLLSMKKDKKPRKKKKPDTKQDTEKEKEKDDKKPDVINEDTQGSDNTMQSKVSEESKLDREDGDTQSKADLEPKEDMKKDDTPTDEEKKLLDEMYEALVKPGPDLVICDEGHRIKNSHSNISYALKQMRTKRRVVLTGYPLQNNLLEYWCMVDFVRPNYLGSKTEFCNMFERPIQNGQCIDSTPQDIRLMRYRAHVLHSLLVGFVQRRSHAVLQSTLPQKEEYVLLVRMTPLQRKLYDRFMNEVVRFTSVPNPLKAFAICCKIWNHPDVLYNFLKKRNEVNMAIEEDLDLEEIGGVTKSGRSRSSRGTPRKPAKPRGSSKKPAATIPPNVAASVPPRQEPSYGNPPYPHNGPYPPPPYGPNQPGGPYPPYPNYQNPGSGYYSSNQGYNQNFDNNFYQQQQPAEQQQQPYGNNYPNQYPQNNQDPNQGYNQNYWGNGNYYNDTGYYNQQYPNNQQPQDYSGNTQPAFNNQQQYPTTNQPYTANAMPVNALAPYQSNQQNYDSQQKSFQPPYPNQPGYVEFNANTPQQPYPSNQPPQNYPNQQYPASYPANSSYGTTQSIPYNQYDPTNRQENYPGYSNNVTTPQSVENNLSQQVDIKSETLNPNYAYDQSNSSNYPDQTAVNTTGNYACPFPNFTTQLETKPPLSSAGSGSPLPSWPLSETIKTEVDKLKAEEKQEIKSESDGEFKIEDLDTKKIVKDEIKEAKKLNETSLKSPEVNTEKCDSKNSKSDPVKSGGSETEDENIKKKKTKGKRKETKKSDKPEKAEKPKPKNKSRAKGRKDRKTSKEKNNDESESEESEKEEKLNREEELALVKKAEEMTYDWATELLKDYVPGIIENSAKMELFFYILNESVKLGDRILLFSQSLFTLNLIEDFLERNYIPGTNCLWKRNTSYYRLDGSTHALEREKLINEFNANPNIYLFLVSTRAGSLGINLVGANRVIVFDASWNPCHDTQAVCRVYRYGQKKPCFVYRFVMDWCLEKKIYDRQINKQGMADRVVDECNPDAVLSMKEITNLCFDNDEKESAQKDLSEYKDKYIDVLMQGIITHLGKLLSKEPFQHESLLVDRKEKKLSSAEKRLAQRGYELEKKAALAPKPTTAYRTVRAADGTLVQRPVASVRPMQHGARWIPADVWRRQGMTAQEMTLPLDVVIPTNSAEKTNIVLKAGQRVMVLKSPKGIYMQLESGKIIAIKTAFKGMGQKGGDNKDNPVGKKVLGSRPTSTNLPGSLKNNSAITITSKSGARPGLNRVITRPVMGQNKMTRPVLPAQRVAEIRNRMAEIRSYSAARAKLPIVHGKMLRPNLPGSVSITKVTKKPIIGRANVKPENKINTESDDDDHTQVLDSEEDSSSNDANDEPPSSKKEQSSNHKEQLSNQKEQLSNQKAQNSSPKKQLSNQTSKENPECTEKNAKEKLETSEPKPIVLTTDEKLPPEEALENKSNDNNVDVANADGLNIKQAQMSFATEDVQKKLNLLKNYRHPRQSINRPQTESSLSQLERTTSSLNTESMPRFRKDLDDITQSYSPCNDDKPISKSKKKKSPNKSERVAEFQDEKPSAPTPGMSHSVSNLLGTNNNPIKSRLNDSTFKNTAPLHTGDPIGSTGPGIGSQPRLANMASSSLESTMTHGLVGSNANQLQTQMPINMCQNDAIRAASSPSVSSGDLNKMSSLTPNVPQSSSSVPGVRQPDGSYGQYPGYGMPYAAYANTPYYGGAYGNPPYYPPYATAPPTNPPVQNPAPENYLPPNPQW